MTHGYALTIGLFVGALAGLAAAPYAVYPHACHSSGDYSIVCGAFSITQPTESLGGPQALEGYTTVAHPRGTVALAIGTIGNVELAGAGDVASARALQGGIVINGPGIVDHATSLFLAAPQRIDGYTGPVRINRADWITFGSSGWSIRPDGDRILLCDAQDRCRDL